MHIGPKLFGKVHVEYDIRTVYSPIGVKGLDNWLVLILCIRKWQGLEIFQCILKKY